jgi:isopentenyl diphosphate isomerase/L-lactate dehydrogenase-like FMN-dependent dehydrogenase
MTSAKAVKTELELIISELRGAMFLTGCKSVSDLPKVRRAYLDWTYELLRQTGGA